MAPGTAVGRALGALALYLLCEEECAGSEEQLALALVLLALLRQCSSRQLSEKETTKCRSVEVRENQRMSMRILMS